MNGIIYRLIKHSFSWLLLWMSLFFLGRGLYIENYERMIGDLIVLSPSIAFCTVYIGGIILKGVLALFDLWKKCKIEEERRIIGVSCEGYCGSQGKYAFGEVYAVIKQSNRKWKRYLPFANIHAYIHDVFFRGMPKYKKGHIYRLTILKYSKIIVKVQDCTLQIDNGYVPCSVSDYAASIIKKKSQRQKH